MGKLKDLRKNKAYTQIKLAQQLGLGQTTVSMWETGKAIPRHKNIENIAKIFNVDISTVVDCFYEKPVEIEI